MGSDPTQPPRKSEETGVWETEAWETYRARDDLAHNRYRRWDMYEDIALNCVTAFMCVFGPILLLWAAVWFIEFLPWPALEAWKQ